MKHSHLIKSLIGAGVLVTLIQQPLHATEPTPTLDDLIQECEDYKAMDNPPAHLAAALNGVTCETWAENILRMLSKQ